MSTNKRIKVEKRGGPRLGTGPEKGSGKMRKISVSVNQQNWQTALSQWNDKGSQLVDRLILRYVERGNSILKPEAAI